MKMDINNTDCSREPTELCTIMSYYGSDKGDPFNQGNHNYTRFYYNLFNPVRKNKLRVFELGLGTNNVNIPSNMGVDGKPGASLRGWQHFFPNAEIFGADIDRDILFKEDRITTYYCDQYSEVDTREMWNNPPLMEDGMDIIIEDGYHVFTHNVAFFENSNYKLNVGGVYIIEDIMEYTLELWRNKLNEWRVRYPHIKFRLYSIPHKNNPHDNRLILAQRMF
jgi:hypothetical protein